MLRSFLLCSIAAHVLLRVPVLAAAPAGVVPSPSPRPHMLDQRGEPVTGHLGPRGKILFRLAATTSFRIDLDQLDADFVLEALGPDRHVLRKVDAFGWSRESATFDKDSGIRFLRVRRVDQEKRTATFVVRSSALTTFSRADELRMRAEDATTAARDLVRDARGGAAARNAIAAFRIAADDWQVTGDDGARLRISLLLADALNNAGDLAEATKLYDDSLAQSRVSGDLRSEIESLSNRGVALRRQASFAAALESMQQALSLWKKLPAQNGYAASLNNLALAEFEIADYESSLTHFSQSRQVLNVLGTSDGDAYILNNMALVEGAIGNWSRSILYFERAAAAFDSMHDYLAAGRALSNSARMYLKAGETARAEANVRRGLELIARAPDDRARAEALALLGEVCTAARRDDEALEHLQLALELSRTAHDRRLEGNALVGLGQALAQSGRKAEAASMLEDGLAIFRKIGTPASQSGSAYRLALVRLDLGRLDQALDAAREAVSGVEAVRGNIAAENVRLSFLASIHDYYSALIEVLMRLGRTAEAWQVAERARARALLESIDGGPRSEDERQLIHRLNSETLKLTRDSSDAEPTRRRVESLIQALGQVRDGVGGLDRPPMTDVNEIQDQLGDDTALIEYAMSESGGYAWVIGGGAISAFRLPAANRIDAQTAALADVVRTPRADAAGNPQFRRAALSLSKMLLQPALGNLNVKRLVIVPDDSLENLPFELLPLDGAPSVIDRYEITEAPSAGVALALKRRRVARAAAPHGVALLADPVFDAGDARVGAKTRRPVTQTRFSRLAFSRREAMAVALLHPPDAASLFLGFDASKETFTSGRLDDYRTIHVSTHGVANSKDPARSGLVLSLVDPSGAPRDGMLSANEISALKLSADIVVLSACDTTIGKQFKGEGLLSTARAFLYAGADKVLGTRWNIDDEATSALLTSFYRSVWRDRLTPEAALRKAQMTIRRDPRWQSPFYWASFVLLGEP